MSSMYVSTPSAHMSFVSPGDPEPQTSGAQYAAVPDAPRAQPNAALSRACWSRGVPHLEPSANVRVDALVVDVLAGEPEVDQLDVAVVGQQEVLGLDIGVR